MKKGQYVIVRATAAGVHAGHFVSRKGQEVVLYDSRRIWYWDGAASLSGLATYGPSKPQNCRFSVAVPEITILDACEVIPCSAAAVTAIKAVAEWKA